MGCRVWNSLSSGLEVSENGQRVSLTDTMSTAPLTDGALHLLRVGCTKRSPAQALTRPRTRRNERQAGLGVFCFASFWDVLRREMAMCKQATREKDVGLDYDT